MKVVEETGVASENHCLTPSHWQLSHMPRFEPWVAVRDSSQWQRLTARPPWQARPQDQTIALVLRNANILSKVTSLERVHSVQINNIYSPWQNKCTANQLNSPCAYRERCFIEYMWLLSLPMLKLYSSKEQGPKEFWKPSKPCHVGIHQIALTEFSQMSTHMPGFQSFLRFLTSFCIGQINLQQHKR